MSEPFLIWQNYDLNLADWKADLQAEFPEASDEKLEQIMHETNWMHLEDERRNLDIDVGSQIICIADIGRWNGRRMGYKLISSGNIGACLRLSEDCECGKFYVDGATKDLCGQETHHDGTNYLRFRAFRKNISDKKYEDFLEALYSGAATEEMIVAATKPIGNYAAKVYGWKLKK